MPRRDFITSIVFLGLGLFVVAESLRMPRMTGRGVPYEAPGILPGLIGAALIFLAILMMIRAARAGGWHLRRPAVVPPEAGAGGSVGSLIVTLALIILYAVVLVGWIPFWLATLIFVFTFVAWFEWQPGLSRWRRSGKIATALLQAVLVAGLVTLLFERVFFVYLP